MSVDVDLLRELVLVLERTERSPPEPVFVSLSDIARRFGRSPAVVEAALDDLLRMQFIDGPGAFAQDWLFRRLTRKGRMLADEVRDMRRWLEIKAHYSGFRRGIGSDGTTEDR